MNGVVNVLAGDFDPTQCQPASVDGWTIVHTSLRKVTKSPRTELIYILEAKMDKDDLALAALEKMYKGSLLRLGGINGPMVRVTNLSRNTDGSGLIDVCIVGSDGEERIVAMASLFDV